ncbi:iron permease FTR1/Fip1/EfeU [Dichotomocladium elegans]|nr:iron permease FTR1/Fip1/EfeU [Dichotomocladium elegans]
MAQDLFNVPIFFIVFRETIEAAIIISVLLSFLVKMFDKGSPVYKRLRNQVWIGGSSALLICLAIGAAFIAVWYTVLRNLWGDSELIWEGVFSLVATIMITMMGLAMLKTERMQEKWKTKLAKAMEAEALKTGKNSWSTRIQRYSFFLLPFITVLREGLEAIVFIGGVALGVEGKSIPIAAIMGIVCGVLLGYIIYRGGNMLRLRWFFVFSTIILYLVAAGLMAKAVGFFEQYEWNKVIGGEAAEESGAVIPYKVTTAVWHVSWGNPDNYLDQNGGWKIFNAILGWNNTATYGTIISYCLYWLLVSLTLVRMHYKERKEAIEKAKRGEVDEEGDCALERAKQFIDRDQGAIIVKDDMSDEEAVPVATEKRDVNGIVKN